VLRAERYKKPFPAHDIVVERLTSLQVISYSTPPFAI